MNFSHHETMTLLDRILFFFTRPKIEWDFKNDVATKYKARGHWMQVIWVRKIHRDYSKKKA